MDDGIFYISYRDFMDAFGSITICYYYDDWKFSYIEGKHIILIGLVLDSQTINK